MAFNIPNDLLDPASYAFAATTPRKVTPAILQFCQQLAPGSQPLYIKYTSWPACIPGQCYRNVDRFLKNHFGEPQHGWLIWELSQLYLNAEHHAVVKTLRGELIDVTPQIAGESCLLFLPCLYNDKIHAEGSVLNHYKPLCNHPLLLRAQELQERNVKLMVDSKAGDSEWRRNDEEISRCFLSYFQALHKKDSFVRKQELRKKKKAERKRKKRR